MGHRVVTEISVKMYKILTDRFRILIINATAKSVANCRITWQETFTQWEVQIVSWTCLHAYWPGASPTGLWPGQHACPACPQTSRFCSIDSLSALSHKYRLLAEHIQRRWEIMPKDSIDYADNSNSVECMYLRQKFSNGSVNKTILKPQLAPKTTRQYVYVGFSQRKIQRCSAYTLSEKAIRLRHLDYNPDRAQKLTSSSMSWHLSTRNISSKSMHMFLSNLANRQTDKQTRVKTITSSFVGGNYEHLQHLIE